MSSESDQVKPDIDHKHHERAPPAAAVDDDDVTDSSIFNPDGLRVLAVDDNVVCLKLLVALLRQCKYNVTETTNPVEALHILRTRKHEFDIVITDLKMLEMDGFILLQKISLEMDLPVVMLSADDAQENVMKAVRYGARDYLIKPPRMAEIQNVWQHVVRKRLFGTNCKDNNNMSSITKEEEEEEETSSPLKVKVSNGDEKGKTCEEAGITEGSKKKRRVNWTTELHNKFLDALKQLGDDAVPMDILKVMNVPWLTRSNVASHLQKHKNAKNDALMGQAQGATIARNEYDNNVNYAAGRNGYQSSATNPFLPQKFSYQQNNQNSGIFLQGTNKNLFNHHQQHNLLMNPSAYPAATMLNNAPLPPRQVLTTQLPVPRFDGLMFSNLGNNMINSYSSSQSFPAIPTAPALRPAPTTYPSAFAAETSSAANADSKWNNMLANRLAPETGNMYPQIDWTAAPNFPDTPMRNSNTKTSDFDAVPLQTTQMETWNMNNNSNLSNTNVEVHHFQSATHEELPVDARFQPINTNLSDEDDNDELNSMVNSFNYEVPPSL